MTAYGKALKEQYTYLVDDSYKVSEYRLLFPLPFDEVEMNKEIKQNEGY